ncbi:MAG: polymerase sigma factor, sigma-70 family [Sedimentibacter sp.]|jgi:RNA polymerase sporulation-specific sigma factor|nr:polymerase sigma factor, sigma-70 family [Sedimentibacter sp.]
MSMISSISIYNNLNYYKEEYDIFSDVELIRKIKDGNEQAERCLYKRYSFIIKRIASSFFIVGGSIDDLIQEAMIGLIKAVNGYDENHENSFRTYAEVCIRRQVITAIRKTKPYETYKSISFYDYFTNDNEEVTLLDEYADLESFNPENLLICEEERNNYYNKATELLTKFERTVLSEYGKGKSYEEISLELNKNVKSIDNALQRIRKKIHCNKEKLMS